VAGADHLPSSGARPELTAAGDAAVSSGLDAASATLDDLAVDVAALGSAGRGALSSLVAGDAAGVAREIAAGQAALDAIDASDAQLRAGLDALPFGRPDDAIRHSPETIDRYGRLVAAQPATVGLRETWQVLATGSVPAVALAARLTGHDAKAGEAALAGSEGRYADALDRLAEAEAELVAAAAIRDDLAERVDVDTLDGWLARNRAIDAALRDLYSLLGESQGLDTPEVQRALASVDAARASLPPDTRALVVILADVARGGLNQAVIAIEEARGRLAEAAGTVQ
jgi:hypothetical protein